MVVAGYDATAAGAVAAGRSGAAPPTAAQALFFFPRARGVEQHPHRAASIRAPRLGSLEVGTSVERLAVDIVGWWVP